MSRYDLTSSGVQSSHTCLTKPFHGGVAARCDRPDDTYLAALEPVSTRIWLRDDEARS